MNVDFHSPLAEENDTRVDYLLFFPKNNLRISKTREDYRSGIARPKIDEKARFELKGRFLEELRDNAFSGTNGEDIVEHIENFLEIVDLLNWKDESIGLITTWVDLIGKFFGKFYPLSRTGRIMEANRRRGDDKEVIIDVEHSNPKDDNLIEHNKTAQILRINTDVFHFETLLCKAFKKFYYLSQIDVDVLTKHIPGFKTFKEYKDDWIHEWNNGIPWVDERPWTDDGVWTKPTNNIDHKCEPLRFKSEHAKWPTCNWKEDGYCNQGDLPGMIREGNSIRYQDYEWYETFEDSKLKNEALINKVTLEGLMNEGEEA
ncbi:hypothetical protein Tco_0183981, partial [Tanacetum coccineum]